MIIERISKISLTVSKTKWFQKYFKEFSRKILNINKYMYMGTWRFVSMWGQGYYLTFYKGLS